MKHFDAVFGPVIKLVEVEVKVCVPTAIEEIKNTAHFLNFLIRSLKNIQIIFVHKCHEEVSNVNKFVSTVLIWQVFMVEGYVESMPVNQI